MQDYVYSSRVERSTSPLTVLAARSGGSAQAGLKSESSAGQDKTGLTQRIFCGGKLPLFLPMRASLTSFSISGMGAC
jgi:hypothetical protein